MHLIAGYIVLGLIVARIVWGFIGSRYARFTDFVYGPRVILRYSADMLRICITGVMMTTDAFWGVQWVDNLHAAASTFALILIGLHIGGVIFSGIEHGEKLVRPMITGMKRAP